MRVVRISICPASPRKDPVGCYNRPVLCKTATRRLLSVASNQKVYLATSGHVAESICHLEEVKRTLCLHTGAADWGMLLGRAFGNRRVQSQPRSWLWNTCPGCDPVYEKGGRGGRLTQSSSPSQQRLLLAEVHRPSERLVTALYRCHPSSSPANDLSLGLRPGPKSQPAHLEANSTRTSGRGTSG